MKGLHPLVIIVLLLVSCDRDEVSSLPAAAGNSIRAGANAQKGQVTIEWLVPPDEVFDGGPGKDGIPALMEPEFVAANSNAASYLGPDDLVVGFKVGKDTRAYPHQILNWHEIINDRVLHRTVAITYCPLTGSAIGWDRRITGQESSFGVSGLIYQSNLMPYDRLTGSVWSQMRLDCVNGDLIETQARFVQVIETRWGTWLEMFPDSKVMSTNTGYSRAYHVFPYGNYRTDHNAFLFPVKPIDQRLPAKERVLGVIINDQAKVYLIKEFGTGIRVIQDRHEGTSLIIVGSTDMDIAVAYHSVLPDGTELVFEPVPNGGSVVLADQEGNRWDVFGECVEGLREGQQLPRTMSLVGYWFTFGSFYPVPKIYRLIEKG